MTCLRHDIRQDRLTDFKRIAAEIVAIHLNQVEGIEERTAVVAPIANVIEAHHAVAVTNHRLTIDDAGSRAQPSYRLHNQPESGTSGHCPGRL
jgi:hypothetical protein